MKASHSSKKRKFQQPVRAILAAIDDPQTGPETLDLMFKGARGAKFAALGVGSAGGVGAGKIAVDAAYASAEAGWMLRPSMAGSITAFLIRDPGAHTATRQESIDQIKRYAGRNAAISLHETINASLKNRVRVVLLARNFHRRSFQWKLDDYLEMLLRDHGWSYASLTEGENLDFEIWNGSAEYAVIAAPDRRLMTRKEIEEVASRAPMYRGPVVLILGRLPDIKIRNQLLLRGIITVSIDRLDLLDNLSDRPLRTIVSRLLRARPTEILDGMAVFVRDHLMRLLWRENADVAICDRSRVDNEPLEIPGWLTETEPFEGKLEPFELNNR